MKSSETEKKEIRRDKISFYSNKLAKLTKDKIELEMSLQNIQNAIQTKELEIKETEAIYNLYVKGEFI